MLLEEIEERFGRPAMLREAADRAATAFLMGSSDEDWLPRNALQVLSRDLHRLHAQMVKGLGVHLQWRWIVGESRYY